MRVAARLLICMLLGECDEDATRKSRERIVVQLETHDSTLENYAYTVQFDGASHLKTNFFSHVLTPHPLGLTETTNGDRVELNAQSWAIGQHASPVFNNDRLFEDCVAERVVADVILD